MAKNIVKIKPTKIKTILLAAFIVLVVIWLNLFNFIGARTDRVDKFVGGNNEARASSLEISTDKNIYNSSETVKISFLNKTQSKLQEIASSSLSVSSKRYLGENYGAGLIEQLIGGNWLAVEPVWRCEASCYNSCPAERLIAAGEQREFYWKQTTLKCNGFNKEEETEAASSGHYRISAAVWDSRAEDYKIVSSNEFEIK